MLKKINRISKRKDFEEVKKRGVLYYSPLFGLLILKTEEKKKEFGLVVSKRISKKAVERNRIRRLLSEGIRKNLGSIKNCRGVFLVKREILGKGLGEIENEIKRVWQRI